VAQPAMQRRAQEQPEHGSDQVEHGLRGGAAALEGTWGTACLCRTLLLPLTRCVAARRRSDPAPGMVGSFIRIVPQARPHKDALWQVDDPVAIASAVDLTGRQAGSTPDSWWARMSCGADLIGQHRRHPVYPRRAKARPSRPRGQHLQLLRRTESRGTALTAALGRHQTTKRPNARAMRYSPYPIVGP
jgi:hypothetical protein